MRERELQALLDARPGPAADRLLAALPPEDRPEARRWLRLARAAGALPAAAPSPGFTERTAARLARLEPPRRRGAALLRRLARWTPACAAAAAGILAVAVPRLAPPPPSEDGAVVARLSLEAPDAREVRAAGDFNRWRPEATPLRRGADGVWRAEVPVPPGGGGQYMFVVDGAWVTDPAAPDRVDDGFGGENALLTR